MPSLRPVLLAILVTFAATSALNARTPDEKAEALVSCPVMSQPEPPPYGLAKAVLISLWYARMAADEGKQIHEEVKKPASDFALMTAMMRTAKMSTNDFICAKKPMKPFATTDRSEDVRLTATAMLIAYDQHIDINRRLVLLLKKMDTMKQTDVIDQISTLEVERGQRWSDLVQPTSLSLMLLVSDRPDEKGVISRLKITKAQKEELLEWACEHFPEFKNGTPKDQWLAPAKSAELFLVLLNSHKGSDE